MRHQQIEARDSYTRIDIAAVWPATTQVAPVPVPEIERVDVRAGFVPTPSCPDVPGAVGGLIAASYVGLVATFAIATVGSGQSIFAIVICAVFLAAFFAVPRLFLAVEPGAARRPSLGRFMHDGIETFTGRCSGRDALIQMLIVPVLLTLGVDAMGIAAAFYL
jgi:hypothetical protein